MERITSTQNPRIKNLKKLEKASERKEKNLILIEGLREILLAKRGGYKIESVFICEELVQESEDYRLSELFSKGLIESGYNDTIQAIGISTEVYRSLAYRDSTEGIIATATPQKLALELLSLNENPLVLVIEAVEKPGNLGAMLRTCDAAGADAVIICDPKTDLYNPNVIRSSIGTVFTNQIAVCETKEVIAFLERKDIPTYAAELGAKKFYYEQNFRKATAIVVGAEASGLSNEWLKAAKEKIKIPMLGEIDSLNVSVSAGILLFETLRQRAN